MRRDVLPSDTPPHRLLYPSRPQFTVGSPVSVARVDSTESLLAVGGRENDLQVWDLETQKSVWKVRARDAVAQR